MKGRIRYVFSGFLLILVSVAVLAGCGQKGPLYLPDDSAQQQQKK